MNQFQGISGSFPDADGAGDPQEELDEELEEVAAKGGDELFGAKTKIGGELFGAKVGGELFGEPTIHPSFYRCSIHGDILAQDVVWGPDDLPHCPECEAELGHE